MAKVHNIGMVYNILLEAINKIAGCVILEIEFQYLKNVVF